MQNHVSAMVVIQRSRCQFAAHVSGSGRRARRRAAASSGTRSSGARKQQRDEHELLGRHVAAADTRSGRGDDRVADDEADDEQESASRSFGTSRAIATAAATKSSADTVLDHALARVHLCLAALARLPDEVLGQHHCAIVELMGGRPERARGECTRLRAQSSHARGSLCRREPPVARWDGRQLAARGPRLRADEGRRDPRALPVASSRSASTCACPRRRSCRRVYDPSVLLTTAGHAAVQAVLPRRGGAARRARLTSLPEVLPHGRHRGRRHDQAPPHLLRDARQLLGRRLLQAGRGGVRLGALDAGLRRSTRSGSGSPSSAATRSSGSGPTRRRSSAGARSASPTSGSSSSAARTTSGSPGRPARAGPARSSTSTAASASAPRTTGPATTPSASSSSGTSSSCSTSCTPDGSLDRAAHAEHRHRHRASSAWRRSSRASSRSSRPTCSGRSCELGEELLGPLVRPGRRDHPRARRARRPRPRRRVPDGRRRGALERGPRLRAAPDHAPRDAPGRTCSASRARSCRSSTSASSR